MCGSVLGYRGIEEIATKSVYQGEWLVGRMAENTRKVEGMTSWGDAKERIKAREIQVKVPGQAINSQHSDEQQYVVWALVSASREAEVDP